MYALLMSIKASLYTPRDGLPDMIFDLVVQAVARRGDNEPYFLCGDFNIPYDTIDMSVFGVN